MKRRALTVSEVEDLRSEVAALRDIVGALTESLEHQDRHEAIVYLLDDVANYRRLYGYTHRKPDVACRHVTDATLSWLRSLPMPRKGWWVK